MRQHDYDKQIMKVVKDLRIAKGLKQFALAQAIGIDRSFYCRIENGEASFSPGQLKLITEALGVSLFHVLFIAESIEIPENES